MEFGGKTGSKWKRTGFFCVKTGICIMEIRKNVKAMAQRTAADLLNNERKTGMLGARVPRRVSIRVWVNPYGG